MKNKLSLYFWLLTITTTLKIFVIAMGFLQTSSLIDLTFALCLSIGLFGSFLKKTWGLILIGVITVIAFLPIQLPNLTVFNPPTGTLIIGGIYLFVTLFSIIKLYPLYKSNK